VQTVLAHVVRRFNYEVDTLAPGDVVGCRPAGVVVTGHESNHGSGTAVDIRPGWYPPGAEALFPHERAVVRDIVRECRGVVA
jgi:hypothetical protein